MASFDVGLSLQPFFDVKIRGDFQNLTQKLSSFSIIALFWIL